MIAVGNLLARTRTCIHCITIRSFASRTDGEERITQVLKDQFPQASHVKVVDISGERKHV
ncbi:hypothetical protein GDO86_009009 [Hymenochirus boettgeri]|uniref:Uncharacterized protein n=1 Tax=Hymenochirus boettgeri TaxID=247094 RepID=A0A8T2JED2_9PIPI|nr:hypothetical protein GDO86_009009 [Hymenochirus boettgeri]